MSVLRGTQKPHIDYSVPLRKIEVEEIEKVKTGKESQETTSERIMKRIETLKEETERERKTGMTIDRSMKWAGVEAPEDWKKLYALSREKYESGEFFFSWIGRGRELEPELVMTLLVLRDQCIKEYEITTVPEYILLDCTILSYYHLIRTNYIIGNIEADIEWNLFGVENPTAKVKKKMESMYGGPVEFKGYSAEDSLRAIKEAQLPMLDTFNRMIIRNLKALRDLKRGNIQLNIGSIGQVNVERGG